MDIVEISVNFVTISIRYKSLHFNNIELIYLVYTIIVTLYKLRETIIEMDDMIKELGLQDCFNDVVEDDILEITQEEIFNLDARISEKVQENEVALNRSAELCAAFGIY